MDFLQEIAISHGSHFNPACVRPLHVIQEHSASIDGASMTVLPRSHHNNNGGLLDFPEYYHPIAEGMDESTLMQPAASNTHLLDTDYLNISSLGLSTNTSAGFAPTALYLPCKMKRRSWQEALSSPLILAKTDISTSTQFHSDMHQVDCISVDNILNLHHIQAGTTNHSTNPPYYLMPTTITDSATHKMAQEEPLITVHEKGIPAQNPSRSFLSALSEGDETFFKQQLLVSTEGICIDDPMRQEAIVLNHNEEGLFYDHVNHDPDVLQLHEFDHHHMMQTNLGMAQSWIHQSNASVVTNRTSPPLKSLCNKSKGLSCAAPTNISKSRTNSDENIRASHGSNASRVVKEDTSRIYSSINGDAIRTEGSRKRTFADHDSASYAAYSKRAHLGPQYGKHSNNHMMRHSGSTSSLNDMSDTATVINDPQKSNGTASSSVVNTSKSRPKSSIRNLLGRALNTNLKPRARQGTTHDPQTVAARNRREKINARLKVLQELVPNGSKVDLVTMLEKAINYVKFLQLQLRVLSNDDYWQANQSENVAMQNALSMDVEENNFIRNTHITTCDHTSMSCTTNDIFIDQS